MSVSTDLSAMLRDELDHLRDDQDRIAAKIAAVQLILGADAEPEVPPATFTAADAREHEARKPKATRKSLRANLDAQTINIIRARAAGGDGYVDLGKAFGVSRSTISNVVNFKGCYA